jgi:hypothetical protein
MEQLLLAHFFQNELEQGAFLFSKTQVTSEAMIIEATDVYLIPPEGWDVQHELYLEMRDTERARIMKMARDSASGVIDCHSHPGSGDQVYFSPSDHKGITEFSAYAKWKLPSQPYAAMVWGEASLDAVLWHGTFTTASPADEVVVLDGSASRIVRPQGTWFSKLSSMRRAKLRGRTDGE